MRTINKTELKNWLITTEPFRAIHQTAPATEPRHFSCDPAFGDFNLPLPDGGVCVARELIAEDAGDIACLRDAIDEGDFESYSDFRRDELGL